MTLAARAATWSIALVAFLLTLEAAARVDDRLTWGAPLGARYDAEVLRERDADGIPRNVPGARFEKWKIDSAGFRGPEVSLAKAKGRIRIACLGQSETFGLFEGEGGEWPERLRRALSQGGDVEVINASVVGTSRSSRVAYLERYVLPFAPDVVVIYPNVYLETYEYAAPAPSASSSPAPTQSAAIAAAALGPDWAGLRPRLLPKVLLQAKKLLPGTWVVQLRNWQVRRTLARMDRSAPAGRPPLDHVPPERVVAYQAHLRELIRLLRARGVRPVLATYPTLAHAENLDRYRPVLQAERLWHHGYSELGLLDAAVRINEATRSVARELAIPIADLDASIPRTDAFFADQVHYTDAGAQAVAEGVLATLRGGGLLPRDPAERAPDRAP